MSLRVLVGSAGNVTNDESRKHGHQWLKIPYFESKYSVPFSSHYFLSLLLLLSSFFPFLLMFLFLLKKLLNCLAALKMR